jgi:hypothetical protein
VRGAPGDPLHEREAFGDMHGMLGVIWRAFAGDAE